MAFVLCCMGRGVPQGEDEPFQGSSPTGGCELREGFPTWSPADHVLVSLANTLWLVVPRRRAGRDESWIIPPIRGISSLPCGSPHGWMVRTLVPRQRDTVQGRGDAASVTGTAGASGSEVSLLPLRRASPCLKMGDERNSK